MGADETCVFMWVEGEWLGCEKKGGAVEELPSSCAQHIGIGTM